VIGAVVASSSALVEIFALPEEDTSALMFATGISWITITVFVLAVMSYRHLRARNREEHALRDQLRTADAPRLAIATQIVDSLLHEGQHEPKAG